MATAQEYAAWLRRNQDKRNTEDYRTVLRAFQEASLDELRSRTAEEPTKEGESGFTPAFRAGVERLKGEAALTAGKLGLMGLKEAEEYRSAREKEAAGIFKPTEAGWTEAPFAKIKELLGGSLPYMAAPIAAGVGVAATPLTGTAAVVGAGLAAGAASVAQFTGSNLARQIEESEARGEDASLERAKLGNAVAAAVPQAALDVFSLRGLPLIRNLFKSVGKDLTEAQAREIAEQAFKKTLADYGRTTLMTAGREGFTEVGQQYLERLQAGLQLTDADARAEYLESLVGGAVLGGVLAPAGRFVERGGEQARARQKLADVEAEQRKVEREEAEKQEALEAEKREDPAYLRDLQSRYTAVRDEETALKDEIAALKKSGDPADTALAKEKQTALRDFYRDKFNPVRDEYNQAGGTARFKKFAEEERIAGLTPLEYQMEQAGVTFPKEAPPQQAGVFTGEGFEPGVQEKPEDAYAKRQLDLARQQDMGTFTEADYAQYLMQDRDMAKRLVATNAQLPGFNKKQSAAILGGMKLQLQQEAKESYAGATELMGEQTTSPQQAFLTQWQEDQAKLDEERRESTFDTRLTELVNTALKGVPTVEVPAFEPEKAAAAGPQQLDLLAAGVEGERPAGEAAVGTRRPAEVLNRLDDLLARRDAAVRTASQAFATGDREAGAARSAEREAAQTALNEIEQQGGAPATVLNLRKQQEAALMNTSGLLDDLRSGTLLGGKAKGAASSTAETIRTQIDKERAAYIDAAIKEAAVTRRLYGKALTQDDALKAALQMQQVFDEWVARTAAAPRREVEEVRVKTPAQMRGAEVVRGAELETYDPRPLEERQFAAQKEATAVLQEQLSQISRNLSAVPEEGRRVQPALKMQFAEAEAAKVAEEKGETAKTGAGALRRKRDYVSTLIDRAFQTRRVPGIAQMLLQRTKDYLEDGRGVTSMLDAAENVADRILRGQNVERSDLRQLRDELRAESMRPGAGEVVGERPGQKELFTAEERRAPLGVIRETREKFENSPPVKKARAAVERGKQLLADIKDAWSAKDAADKAKRNLKIEETQAAIDKQREVYRETFQAALKKAQMAEIEARFQKEITEALQSLQAVSKERAAAEAAGDMDAVRQIDVIRDTERAALLQLQADLAKALETPSQNVEPAQKTGVRPFQLPAELQAAADEWVQFERDRLTKLEDKLKRLQGSEKKATAKAVVAQRSEVKQATMSVERAMSGLGLPGVRVEGRRVTPIESAEETRKQRERDEAERRQMAAEEAAQKTAQKKAREDEITQELLDLGTEYGVKQGQLARAKTDASKDKLRAEMTEIENRATILEAELGTPELTPSQKAKLRKARASLFSGRGVSSNKELLTSIAQKIEDKQPLTAYEQQVWEGRKQPQIKRKETPAKRAARLATASEALKKETAGPRVGEFGEALGVEDVMSSFDIGGKDVFFSRGPTANPSTTASVSAELNKVFPNLGRVQIYDTVDALIAANPQYKGKIPSDARGFVDTAGNKAFLIAENIDKGRSLSVLLHEVGAHIGLKNMLGEAQYNALVRAVESWEKRNDGSLESRVAQAARARIEAAQTPASQVNDELLAYAIEEAVNAGVKPMETKGVIGQWLSRIASLFSKALQKFGLPPKKLTADELVNMAFGAAKLEMTPKVPQVSRRQFLRGAAATAGALKLPPLSEDMKTAALKKIFDASNDAYTTWINGLLASTKTEKVRTLIEDFNDGFSLAEKAQTKALRDWFNLAEMDALPDPELQLEQLLSGKDGVKIVADLQQALRTQAASLLEAVEKMRGKKETLPEVGELFFSKTPKYNPALATAGSIADRTVSQRPGFFAKMKENMLGMGFRTQFVDALAPMEKVAGQVTDAVKATQMMYYLRMYGQRMNFTSLALSDGVPQLVEKKRKDGTSEWVIESVPGINIKDIVKRLSTKEVIKAAGSADAANRLFTLYLAKLRADNKGYDALNFGRAAAEAELKQIQRDLVSDRVSNDDKARLRQRQAHLNKIKDTLPTEADIKAAFKEIEANPTLRDAFADAREMYNQYNQNLLQFMVQTGAMSKEEAARLLKEKDYVPYYRVRDGVAQLVIGGETPVRVGNLKDSPHLNELVGGEEPIFSFLDSSVQNTSMLIDMAMRNIAVKNAMWEMGKLGYAKVKKTGKSGAPKGAVEFKEDGEDYHAVVDTEHIGIPSELLVKGLAGIPTMFPAAVEVMGIPARFLRRAVTASPLYAFRQLMRDSLSSFIASGANTTPLFSALNQIKKASAVDRRGITGGQVFTGLPEDMSRLLADMQAGRSGWGKAFAKLEAMSMEADAATRRAQYESYIKQGLSEMEATMLALESMNFTRRGLSPSVQLVTSLIPFMNAQIQSLDVLYRSFRGQMPFNERLAIREKLITRGLMLAGMTMAYALAMQDDEDYQNATPDQKYNNWFVPIPGLEEKLRVPIPFELGYIFKALPEAIINSMYAARGADEAQDAALNILRNLIPGGSNFGVPQAVKPLIEVGLGKSFFTGRDIETGAEKMQEPWARYRDNTSEAAKFLGKLFNISPIKIETLVSGYTGSMGLALMQATNLVLPGPETAKADKRLSEMPVIGSAFQPKDATGIINDTFDRLKEATEAKDTYDKLIERGELQKADAYLSNNADRMTLASLAGDFRQQIGEITKAERQVRGADISAQEKREMLDSLRQSKILLASSVRAVLDTAARP